MAYVLPARFYDRVDEGSIVLKRCDSFGFRADGLVLDGTGERVDADVVILATGFDIERLLSSACVSPWFREIIAAGPSDAMLPLYRTWGTSPGGSRRKGSSPTGCSRTGTRTTPTSSEEES
nr:probable flavin-containing monooxygenase 1 [Setaria viridis]XP_034598509.1 probable flavin-containing monooxygenase 1 [Setaria viridis]